MLCSLLKELTEKGTAFLPFYLFLISLSLFFFFFGLNFSKTNLTRGQLY